jgi:hypothetical protein
VACMGKTLSYFSMYLQISDVSVFTVCFAVISLETSTRNRYRRTEGFFFFFFLGSVADVLSIWMVEINNISRKVCKGTE